MDLTLTTVGRTSPTYRRLLKRAAAMLEEALNDPEVLEKLSQAEEANAKVEASTPGDEGTVEDGERLADEVIVTCPPKTSPDPMLLFSERIADIGSKKGGISIGHEEAHG